MKLQTCTKCKDLARCNEALVLHSSCSSTPLPKHPKHPEGVYMSSSDRLVSELRQWLGSDILGQPPTIDFSVVNRNLQHSTTINAFHCALQQTAPKKSSMRLD